MRRYDSNLANAVLDLVSMKLNHDRCAGWVSRASRLGTADLDGVTHRKTGRVCQQIRRTPHPPERGGLRHKSAMPICG